MAKYVDTYIQKSNTHTPLHKLASFPRMRTGKNQKIGEQIKVGWPVGRKYRKKQEKRKLCGSERKIFLQVSYLFPLTASVVKCFSVVQHNGDAYRKCFLCTWEIPQICKKILLCKLSSLLKHPTSSLMVKQTCSMLSKGHIL